MFSLISNLFSPEIYNILFGLGIAVTFIGIYGGFIITLYFISKFLVNRMFMLLLPVAITLLFSYPAYAQFAGYNIPISKEHWIKYPPNIDGNLNAMITPQPIKPTWPVGFIDKNEPWHHAPTGKELFDKAMDICDRHMMIKDYETVEPQLYDDISTVSDIKYWSPWDKACNKILAKWESYKSVTLLDRLIAKSIEEQLQFKYVSSIADSIYVPQK